MSEAAQQADAVGREQTAESVIEPDDAAQMPSRELDVRLDLDELPEAPPELSKRATRLRPVLDSVRARSIFASGSERLRRGRSVERTRDLGGRAARRASRELSLTRYELRDTWHDVTRVGWAWQRRRHGVRKGQEALERYRDLGDHRREALELNALGCRYRERGHYGEAVVCYTQALTIFERLGNPRGRCLSLSNLGLTHDAQGNRQKAVRCYEDALDLAHMLGDRQIEGQILANLGTSYARQGRQRESRELWQQALTLLTPGSSAHAQLSRHLGVGT